MRHKLNNMKLKTLIFTFLLIAGFCLSGFSQIKIGYTNIELVLAYMPEARQVEQQLQTIEKKMGEQLQVKQNYAQAKLEDYAAKVKNNEYSPEARAAAEGELQKLDKEIQDFVKDSEDKLLTKREQLLVPVLEKLQKSIDDVAKEKGYTYILNQTTSAGVSTILYGPEEDNVTEAIMNKLGIQVPKSNEGPK